MVAAMVMPLVTKPFTTSMTSLAVKESRPVNDTTMDLVSDVTCNKPVCDIRLDLVSQYSSVTGTQSL